MKSLFILCPLLLMVYAGQAQIMGISASKLSAFNTFPVPHKVAEFEPTFGLNRSSGLWNRGGFIGSDTISVAGSINWRLTYGLLEDLELGLNVLSDASYGNFSVKAKIYEQGDLSLGAMAGVGMPLGNRTYAHSDPTINDVSNYVAGLIVSYNMDTLTSVDFNVQYQDYFRDVVESVIIDAGPFSSPQEFKRRLTGSTIFINADVGSYVIDDKIQLLLGGGYQSTVIDNLGGLSDYWTTNLFLEGGVSVEVAEHFIIVLGIAHSIWGKNSQKTTSIGLAFTTIWD